MALFSDVDWAIILVAAAFLFFGPENRQIVRTLGRYYARAMRMREELLGQVARAADLPVRPGEPVNLREALLGDTTAPRLASGIPAAVTQAPKLTYPPTGSAWTGAMGPQSWSMALPPLGPEGGGGR